MKNILLMALFSVALTAAANDVEWDVEVGLDNSIYPSLIIATSTLQLDEDEDETQLGDPMGLTGVWIKAPADNTPVVVEVSSGKLIQPSRFTGVLKKQGETYYIAPMLKYDYDTLLAVRQPFPEVVTASVSVNGEALGEKSKRVPVRSINDCVLGFDDDDGGWVDTSWLMAAYVNENHPVVDEILREAIDSGDVDSFAGYQKDGKDLLEEMEAIWNAIQNRGFRYSNITQSSGESATVASQHVRLIGDAVKTAQANCVEGSVLFASIFRKLDMDPFLVLIPGHMFVGVYLDEDHEDYICLETTMVGESSFEDAVEAGNDEFSENEEYLLSEEDDTEKTDKGGKWIRVQKVSEEKDDIDPDDFAIIDIEASRQMGIMPISEAGTARK